MSFKDWEDKVAEAQVQREGVVMGKPRRQLAYVCDRCGFLAGCEADLFEQAAGTQYCGVCHTECGDAAVPSADADREARAWEVFLAIIEHRHAGKLPDTASLIGRGAARDAFAYVDAFEDVAEEQDKLGLP